MEGQGDLHWTYMDIYGPETEKHSFRSSLAAILRSFRLWDWNTLRSKQVSSKDKDQGQRARRMVKIGQVVH
jgi:hypothetical protein